MTKNLAVRLANVGHEIEAKHVPEGGACAVIENERLCAMLEAIIEHEFFRPEVAERCTQSDDPIIAMRMFSHHCMHIAFNLGLGVAADLEWR
jgi:hypothetical protein